MKRTLILLAFALPAFAAEFDMKLLDKLGANAKESTNITLDSNMLKTASRLLGDGKDSDAVKSKLAGLKDMYIRSFEFDAPGKYNAADLDPLRNWLDSQHWTRIVDVKDSKETSTIWALSLPGNQPGGLAIVSAEEKEVTVVLIEGAVGLDDVGKLGGNLGIPDMSFLAGGKNAEKDKPKNKTGDAK